MRRKLTIIAVMLGFVLGCLSGLAVAKEALAGSQEELTLAYTKFGFKLFGKLNENKEQNIFVSPVSVAFALAMTYNGAAAETRQAMAGALEIQGLSLTQANQANGRLLQALSNPGPQIRLNIANSLWLNQGQQFNPEFLKRNEEFYRATLKALDFRDPRAPETINAWVAQETAGKITRIVEKISPPLLIVNAIHFKGPWTRPFTKALTKELPFTLLNGKQKQAPMMSQSGNYRYFRGNNFQAVSLPYGEKGRFSMKIFLPDKNSSLKEFCAELHAAHWRQWLPQFQTAYGSIVLPRFKFEFEASLKEPLRALGMGVAFDKLKANFSQLCATPPGVFIDEVKHKTFVEVNEEGTEAAAVTAVMMATSARAAPPKEVFSMIVDRPFFVAIDDLETGTILFMGAIVEPK